MHANSATRPQFGMTDRVAAELTSAAYRVVLGHGKADSWVDLELELWKVLSETLRRLEHGSARAPEGSKTPRDGRLSAPQPTSPMLERLVTYFGLDEAGQPTSRRVLSYKIIAGPGPNEDSGVASIITLALTNPGERCDSCQRFHTVDKGGAAAAMAAAIRYLDAYHDGDRLRKVESDVRG